MLLNPLYRICFFHNSFFFTNTHMLLCRGSNCGYTVKRIHAYTPKQEAYLPAIYRIFYLRRQEMQVFTMLHVIFPCPWHRPCTPPKELVPCETVVGKCQPSVNHSHQVRHRHRFFHDLVVILTWLWIDFFIINIQDPVKLGILHESLGGSFNSQDRLYRCSEVSGWGSLAIASLTFATKSSGVL